MRKHRPTSSTLALILALSLFSASCGQEGQATDQPTAPANEPETLGDFLGWEDYDAEAEEERWRQQELQMQEVIAECMAEEGWEYTPWIFEEQDDFGWPGEGLSHEEFTAQFGYGMFTMMLWEADRFEEGVEPWSEPNDPNHAYVETLGEAEQQAYFHDLHGDHESWFEEHRDEMEAAEESGEWIEEPTYEDIGGCWNLAIEQVGMRPNPELEKAWNELWPMMDEMEQRINADERVVAANAEWSACMTTAGHDFANQEEIWRYLDEFMIEMWEGGDESPATTLPQEQPEDGEEFEEDWRFFPPGVSREDVEALAEMELEIAASDLACQEAHPIDEILEEVRTEYEAQFVAENRAQLEKIRELEQAWRN